MKFIKKAPIIFLFLALLLPATVFSFGCSTDNELPNDGFNAVYKVEYTELGKETTSQSSAFEIIYLSETISREEYLDAPEEKIIYPELGLSEYHKISKEVNGATRYIDNLKETVSDDLIRYVRYRTGTFEYSYYKVKLSQVVYSYVYVKIVDTDTIIIRNCNGETTYTVTSYNITNFK